MPVARSAWQSSAAGYSPRCTSRRHGARRAFTSSASPISRPRACARRPLGAGWPEEALGAHSADDARRTGSTWLTDDAAALIAADGVEVVIEATGDAPAGVEHALLAIAAGRHVIMVNVEADALVVPPLARGERALRASSTRWPTVTSPR